jgi:hypothetical protein
MFEAFGLRNEVVGYGRGGALQPLLGGVFRKAAAGGNVSGDRP